MSRMPLRHHSRISFNLYFFFDGYEGCNELDAIQVPLTTVGGRLRVLLPFS
jgi:hypothetical protein